MSLLESHRVLSCNSKSWIANKTKNVMKSKHEKILS